MQVLGDCRSGRPNCVQLAVHYLFCLFSAHIGSSQGLAKNYLVHSSNPTWKAIGSCFRNCDPYVRGLKYDVLTHQNAWSGIPISLRYSSYSFFVFFALLISFPFLTQISFSLSFSIWRSNRHTFRFRPKIG